VKLAIHDLAARRPPTRADVDRFLDDQGPFPLVEGSNVTFTFRGEADRVRLHHWIYGLPSAQELMRLPGTDLWYFVLDLPPGSRMEYKLEVAQGGLQRLILDPLNPNIASDPIGNNSVVHGKGYETPEWIHQDEEARPGSVEKVIVGSETLRSERAVQIYLPARFHESRRYPLLVVHDGADFLHFCNLKTILDNLIHRHEIPPMIVALTDSPRRLIEYADDEAHAAFLAEELVPLLEERYPLVKSPSGRGLAGASFGAVASLAAAWRHPGVFDNLLLLSGSFAFTDIGAHDRGPVFDPVVDFVNRFREAPGRPAERLYVACGIYESLIYYNRSMVPLLQDTGMQVRFVEVRDGHNWENWRDRLREGLSWLFPGPLWMVYE